MKKTSFQSRIWELDFARGVAIVIVVLVHLTRFLIKYTSLGLSWPEPIYYFKQYAGFFFVLLSGICIAFSKNSFKRGLIVFGCGLIITAWTSLVYYVTGDHELIRWGVLHLIGFCMMLYPLIKKLPQPIILVLALALIIAGYYVRFECWTLNPYLFPLGIKRLDFHDADCFPIIPHLGWFMLGVWLKPHIYKEKKTLFPNVDSSKGLISAFCWLGRHSIWIYMIHLPLFYIIIRYCI